MEYLEITLIIINLLIGLVMYFIKTAYDEIKAQQKEHQQELNHIKDTYFKKEDFRDFRDELWLRLDKMEAAFEAKVASLNK